MKRESVKRKISNIKEDFIDDIRYGYFKEYIIVSIIVTGFFAFIVFLVLLSLGYSLQKSFYYFLISYGSYELGAILGYFLVIILYSIFFTD